MTAGVTWQLHSTGIAMTDAVSCGMEEHQHDESCWDRVLVCGLEEGEEATEAGEGATETSGGHIHTEECYELQLVCGMEEHTHNAACVSDENADVETADDWEATLPELTGVWAEDVVAVAKSQLGYTESTSNFILADDGVTRQGYTRYGAWYGNEYGVWDAMFASFCLYYAGVDESAFPESSGVYAWAVKLDELGLYVDATDGNPTSGDLVLFDTDDDGKADHVGILTALSDGEMTVIEGDSQDAVAENTYGLDDGAVLGYGLLPAQFEELEETEEENVLLSTTAGAGTSENETNGIEVATTAETPVTAVQALIDAMPTADEVAAMPTAEQAEVYDQLQATYEAYEALSTEEQAQVDDTAFDELFEYFNGQVTVTAAAGIDILAYIENYSDSHNDNPATATITVEDADGNEVEADENGDYTLIVGDAYNIALDFYFEASIEAGTYVYTFPDGVTLTNGSGYVTIVDNEGTERTLGAWSIDSATGELTFTIYNLYDLSEFSEITLSASVSAVFENEVDEVTIGDVTYTVIEPPEDTSTSLHKQGVEVNETDGTISWVIEVDGGDNVGLAEQTITDTISTDNHELLRGNINSLTIEIQADDGECHTLSIDEVWLDWSESGWEITLPEEFECTSCRETITLPREDSTGWVVYIKYTTSITRSGSFETYGNTVQFYDLEEKGEISAGEGGIDKTGVYNAGDSWEDTTIDWTIEAFIPSGKVYNWYISDTEDVVVGSTSQQYYYNALGGSGTTITATIDGETYSVPNLADVANDGSDLIAWELYETTTENGYACGRAIRFYTWDSSIGEWSQGWNIGSDTYLTITYSSSVVYDDENLIEEYNTQGASLRNSVQLRNNGTDGRSENEVAKATAEVPLPSFLDKEQTTAPTSGNEWVVTYTVTFNAAMVNLSDLGTVDIVDTMSSTLAFMRDSISITAKDADGNTHKVTDYTIEYSNNVAKIILNESALGPYQYTLVYSARINGSGEVSYSNSASVTVFGETITDVVGTKVVNGVSAVSQSYSVTLTKQDADTESPLAGAVFNVYNAEADALLITVTTGTDGKATVQTSTAQGVIFSAHTLYYLIETKAPDGYVLDNTTRYYFWFCDTDGGTCSTCDSMTDELKAKEGNDVKLYKGVYDSSLTVENIAITVTNEPGVELPNTGGSGTYWYTMAGMLLMSGCAYLLYIKLRRRKEGKCSETFN